MSRIPQRQTSPSRTPKLLQAYSLTKKEKAYHLKRVTKLQRRIAKAEQQGNSALVLYLQLQLVNSYSSRFVAVDKVAQRNKGKATPGIDGVANLTEQEMLDLVDRLDPFQAPQPLWRVLIPKGDGTFRPLAIPTMYDRAVQELFKLALEPVWEPKLEDCLYAYRKGRGVQQALLRVCQFLSNGPMFAYNTDIKSFFTHINHDKLLEKVGAQGDIRKQLEAMLKVEVLCGGKLTPTKAGTPQGGVISPLLANIALNGLNAHITADCQGSTPPKVVVYADNILLLHHDLTVLKVGARSLVTFLHDSDLELNHDKTQLVATSSDQKLGHSWGFTFLGWKVEQYPLLPQILEVTGATKGYETLLTRQTKPINPEGRSRKEILARKIEIIENESTSLSNVVKDLARVTDDYHYYVFTWSDKAKYPGYVDEEKFFEKLILFYLALLKLEFKVRRIYFWHFVRLLKERGWTDVLNDWLTHYYSFFVGFR